MKKLIVAMMLTLAATSAHAANYTVDYAASKVAFSGQHAGNDFNGVFEKWTAEIVFDAAHLDKSSLKASFDLASAKTGNSMYDGTLPSADWFDVAKTPKGEFVSTAIAAKGGNAYEAVGKLTIRGITKPVTVTFTLSDIAKNPVTVDGKLTLNRLDFDLGKKSDATAEWVSKDIGITLHLQALAK